MKRIFAYILLLSHIQFTMFIPQVDELDIFNSRGMQVGDINNLYEYIDELVFNQAPDNDTDEDDDTARYYHVQKTDSYCFQQTPAMAAPPFRIAITPAPSTLLAAHTAAGFTMIQIPPPKA